jgi:ubiquitin C-terminal hydrolase
LLSVYLKLLHNELSYVVTSNIMGTPNNETEQILLKSYENFMECYETNYSGVINLFAYQITTTKHCQKCSNISHLFDIDNTLDLHIPQICGPDISLTTLLDNRFCDIPFSAYHCSKCVCKTGSINKLDLTMSRNILIINLNNKHNTKVTYPKIFDLDKYKLIPDNKHYQLMSIGCYNKDTNSTYSICYQNDKWIKYTNDGQEQLDEFVTHDAYCLFYQNTNEKAIKFP